MLHTGWFSTVDFRRFKKCRNTHLTELPQERGCWLPTHLAQCPEDMLLFSFWPEPPLSQLNWQHRVKMKTNAVQRRISLSYLIYMRTNRFRIPDASCGATTLRWLLPWVCLLSLQYSSSRPSSAETARLGSRTNSMSSHTRPERDLRPLSLRYSSPQRSSYLQPTESPAVSQIYSTPYSALHRASPQRLEKAPLVKVIQSGV